jgi:hypothetical protein
MDVWVSGYMDVLTNLDMHMYDLNKPYILTMIIYLYTWPRSYEPLNLSLSFYLQFIHHMRNLNTQSK